MSVSSVQKYPLPEGVPQIRDALRSEAAASQRETVFPEVLPPEQGSSSASTRSAQMRRVGVTHSAVIPPPLSHTQSSRTQSTEPAKKTIGQKFKAFGQKIKQVFKRVCWYLAVGTLAVLLLPFAVIFLLTFLLPQYIAYRRQLRDR